MRSGEEQNDGIALKKIRMIRDQSAQTKRNMMRGLVQLGFREMTMSRPITGTQKEERFKI